MTAYTPAQDAAFQLRCAATTIEDGGLVDRTLGQLTRSERRAASLAVEQLRGMPLAALVDQQSALHDRRPAIAEALRYAADQLDPPPPPLPRRGR